MIAYRLYSLLFLLCSALGLGIPSPSAAQQPIRIGSSIAISGRDAIQGWLRS
jgi:hypothetical protein